ncbi:MAG TPA: CDP-alcohol phosphatidyltransferase family protein [Longimicrobiales bacterium]|nr:CDP-alcohol phosphatidyltransferase family protein [Longimicrobiales bacterium]
MDAPMRAAPAPIRRATDRAAVVLNAANALSALRFPLAALFPFVSGGARVAVVAAAAVSDLVDGRMARRTGTVTRAGELLDPLADKTFMLSALVTLAAEDVLPWWTLPALLTRDIGVAAGALMLAARKQRVRMPARRAGKIVTLMQFTAIGAMILWPETSRWMALPIAAAGLVALNDYRHSMMGRREIPH